MHHFASCPRPEYPRPDFQRGTIEGVDWINLNGPWQFRFDHDRRGLTEHWFDPAQPPWREQILVPFCWESLAAWGEGDSASNENYYSTRAYRQPLEVNRANHSYQPRFEVGWYRRRITIPNSQFWNGCRIILKIGAADFLTQGWCNGEDVGHHEGGYTPFEFDLTDSLTRNARGEQEGVVILRVEDPMDNSQQPVGKQWHWYTPTSGIWQTVWVEPRQHAYLRGFRVYPDIDAQSSRFEFEAVNAGGGEVRLHIESPKGEKIELGAVVKGGRAFAEVSLPGAPLWNPNEPNLFRCRFLLSHHGTLCDQVQSYFGMRKIDYGLSEDPKAPSVLRLNNVPRYLRGALYQSYHPAGVYTAPDIEVIKNDILWAKKFGFNFLRVHIKIDDPWLYYFADTLGIMLMADFPNFGEGGDTPKGRRRFEKMMRAAVARDFNHPSIVSWCVFNETWGFGGQVELIKHFPDIKKQSLPKKFEPATFSPALAPAVSPPEGIEPPPEAKRMANQSSHAWVQSMWKLTKELDPTRLVEDMSVVSWEHLDYYAHGDTDINSWHFYIHDYTQAREHIEKVVRMTYAGSSYNYVPGFQQKSQPLINSEYGGIGALDGNRDISWSFKFLTNELRRHGQISAYIYTELHDVEWEYNGFLNYDRTPKQFGYDPRMINESDVLPIDAPPIARYLPGQRVKIPVASSHYATRPESQVVLTWRLSGVDGWGRMHSELSRGRVPIHFPHRRVAPAHEIELTLPPETMLCNLEVEAISPLGERLATNFVQLFVVRGEVRESETAERAVIRRAFPGRWSAVQWTGGFSGADQAIAEDCGWGHGTGFFEWHFPLDDETRSRIRRLRFISESSSRRVDTPQTDDDHYPTTLQVTVNGTPIHEGVLIDHPHDARGSLSYLRGGRGAHGYLTYAAAEGEFLEQILHAQGGLTLRMGVPEQAMVVGGMTIYGMECGRYPFAPSLILEW